MEGCGGGGSTGRHRSARSVVAASAAALVLVATMASFAPGARLSGLVGSAASYLSATSLAVVVPVSAIQPGNTTGAVGGRSSSMAGNSGGSEASRDVAAEDGNRSSDAAPAAAPAPAAASDAPAPQVSPGEGGGSAERKPADSTGDAEGSAGGSGSAGAQDGRAASGGSSRASAAELADAPAAGGPRLECHQSGYCSVGKLQPYVGEVDSTEGFKKMLAGGCYRRECFLVTIGSRDQLLGMNFVAGAWRLGLANVILHAASRGACATLAAAGYANVTCVWSRRSWFPAKVAEATTQWAVRYILMARALWLGHGVCLLDADSYLFRDPYRYLKAPPLARVAWLSMSDNGGELINGGATCVQGAAPGGPAAWTLAAAAERMIRVNENWEAWAALNGLDPGALGHAMMDQFVLSDAVAGSYRGHPYVGFTQPAAVAADLYKTLRYGQPGLRPRWPPEWANLTARAPRPGEEPGQLAPPELSFDLSITFLDGRWDESIGGRRFPRMGNHSRFFVQLLEEESGHAFVDVEGAAPAGWAPPANETFMMAPEWLMTSWARYRRLAGLLDLDPPEQVILHVMYVPTDMAATWQKEYALKALRAWHFDVSAALSGGLFPVSTPEQPLPRVLALPPGTRLATDSAQHYRDQLLQLVRLAMRAGRVVLLPDPEPHTWLGGSMENQPLRGHARHFCNMWHGGLHYGLDGDEHCLWWAVLEAPCMPGAYIAHPDYMELLRRLPDGAGTPGTHNTVPVERPANGTPGGGSAWAAAAEAAAARPEPRVLFLGAAPDLSPAGVPAEAGEADERWRAWIERCSWARAAEPHTPEEWRRRRRLRERGHPDGGWQRGRHGGAHWLAGQRHAQSLRGGLLDPG